MTILGILGFITYSIIVAYAIAHAIRFFFFKGEQK